MFDTNTSQFKKTSSDSTFSSSVIAFWIFCRTSFCPVNSFRTTPSFYSLPISMLPFLRALCRYSSRICSYSSGSTHPTTKYRSTSEPPSIAECRASGRDWSPYCAPFLGERLRLSYTRYLPSPWRNSTGLLRRFRCSHRAGFLPQKGRSARSRLLADVPRSCPSPERSGEPRCTHHRWLGELGTSSWAEWGPKWERAIEWMQLAQKYSLFSRFFDDDTELHIQLFVSNRRVDFEQIIAGFRHTVKDSLTNLLFGYIQLLLFLWKKSGNRIN